MKIYEQKPPNFIIFLFPPTKAVLFLVGQYILAGKLVDNSIISKEQQGYFIAKQRRNVANSPRTAFTPKLLFPSTYHVTGVLKLPYGNINEPFEAWYSKDEKMSRIDYYGGNVF